jgi:hypothetical protein
MPDEIKKRKTADSFKRALKKMERYRWKAARIEAERDEQGRPTTREKGRLHHAHNLGGRRSLVTKVNKVNKPMLTTVHACKFIQFTS